MKVLVDDLGGDSVRVMICLASCREDEERLKVLRCAFQNSGEIFSWPADSVTVGVDCGDEVEHTDVTVTMVKPKTAWRRFVDSISPLEWFAYGVMSVSVLVYVLGFLN